MFEGLADKAAERAESNAPDDSQPVDKAPDLNANPEESTTETPREPLDLAKAGEFTFEGQKMTYEDLKKAYLRHQDYTQKTQALSQERKTYEEFSKEKKFYDNLKFDLQTVRKNPTLASEFKKQYPEKFHQYLSSVLDEEPKAKQELPQEIIDKLQAHDEALKSFNEERERVQQEQIVGQLDTWEKGFLKKYPSADPVHVYSALSNYTAKMRESNPEFNFKDLNERAVESIYKSVHDHFEKQYSSWQNMKLKQIRDANKNGSDIPPGGGTPTEAPKKMKLKDVADHILSSPDFNE